jgi:hypothetical protein
MKNIDPQRVGKIQEKICDVFNNTSKELDVEMQEWIAALIDFLFQMGHKEPDITRNVIGIITNQAFQQYSNTLKLQKKMCFFKYFFWCAPFGYLYFLIFLK